MEKLQSELRKAQSTVNHLKTTKVADLEVMVADREAENELLKQMIRSLKTEVNVKMTDISRLQKKVKRLDEANDMRHEFIQSHFKKAFKPKKTSDKANVSMVEEKEGVVLPPLNKKESKHNVSASKRTPQLKSRKGS